MKTPTIESLQAKIKELELENEFLKHNHLGVLTRQAIQLEERRNNYTGRVVIGIDIDYLHNLNSVHGQPAVDEMIKRAFSLRDGDSPISFNNDSGDEYGFIIENSNPQRFIERLQASLKDNGLSATMAWELIGNEPNNLRLATDRAMTEVKRQKAARGIVSR